MTSAAIIFFVLAIIAVIVGAFGITGVSIETIELLSVALLLMGVLSYTASAIAERKNHLHQS